MSEGPRTYRNHLLSIYQSAAASLMRPLEGDTINESRGFSPQPGLLDAVTDIAALRMDGRTEAQKTFGGTDEVREAMSAAELAKVCASLGLQYLEAKLWGDEATAVRIKSELTYSTCDPRWVGTIEEYLRYFGPGGTRKEVPYIRAAAAGEDVITIPSAAKIGLVGDWGTGAESARRVLRHLRKQQPDIIVHLGDIYYSGTPEECEVNFEQIMEDVFGTAGQRIPVFTLAGNHDMYSGGAGYYALIQRLNRAPNTQRASFFCLRTEDGAWQFLGMDTGLHDYNPFTVSDAVTFIEADEEQWHKRRIEEFAGKTILLSHHQLFSAFSRIGKPDEVGNQSAFNPKLRHTFELLKSTGKPIPAWFWGHEHNLCIYDEYIGLARGRCIGCSAIPVFAGDDPYDQIEGIVDPPSVSERAKLKVAGNVYAHAFATLQVSRDSKIEARYFEETGRATSLKHAEFIE